MLSLWLFRPIYSIERLDIKEITKDEKNYLLEKEPKIELTIIGKSKGKRQKRYYVPDCKSVNYWLKKFHSASGGGK